MKSSEAWTKFKKDWSECTRKEKEEVIVFLAAAVLAAIFSCAAISLVADLKNDTLTMSMLFFYWAMFLWLSLLNHLIHNQRVVRDEKIADVNLQIEELMERLDDNSRYIGQDTSRPSAPEAQDDGRDAEDHAA